MRNFITIWKKEFFSYFNSPIAYFFIIIFIILTSVIFLFYKEFFSVNQATMRGYFETFPLVFVIFAPAITMRLWAEEKKSGTDELLMTLPMREVEIVFGKFFAAWSVLTLSLALTLHIPIVISNLGELDWGPVVGAYIGSVLLGGAYLAIGTFISSIGRNQIISYILTTVICLILVGIGHQKFLDFIYDVYSPLVHYFAYIGFLQHFKNISKGIIDTKDIVYFISVIIFFLVLNRFSIEAHRYS